MVLGVYLLPLFVGSNAQLPPHAVTNVGVNRPRCQALVPKNCFGIRGIIHPATGFIGDVELELTNRLDA